jgi:hypothetical protein
MSQGRVVSFDGLTRDNTLLSRSRIEPSATRKAMVVSTLAPALVDPICASTCTDYRVRTVSDYVEAGIAPSTRRAYCTDLDRPRYLAEGLDPDTASCRALGRTQG